MTNKNETADEFEARMITRFNEQVNQPESLSHQTTSSVGKKDPQEVVGSEKKVPEKGGPKGLEPTRYGDWEAKGRCHDF